MGVKVDGHKDDGIEEHADHAWGDCAAYGKVEAVVGIGRHHVVEHVHRDRRLPPPNDVGGGNRCLIYRVSQHIEKGAEREARARKHFGGLGSSSSNVGFPDPWLVIYPRSSLDR